MLFSDAHIAGNFLQLIKLNEETLYKDHGAVAVRTYEANPLHIHIMNSFSGCAFWTNDLHTVRSNAKTTMR